ncbi:hypothetical protein [Solirubrobacter soli]|uniref:hypothetical protein n=1 Tax=Solirubrobacter soli TaxID=363832 RepID=UPI000410B560|nr:hypothetical protein [Solirubrobacter soli]
MNAPVTATFHGGPFDGRCQDRDAEDLPRQLRVFERSEFGPREASYVRRNEPDLDGRVVYVLLTETHARAGGFG